MLGMGQEKDLNPLSHEEIFKEKEYSTFSIEREKASGKIFKTPAIFHMTAKKLSCGKYSRSVLYWKCKKYILHFNIMSNF